MTRTRRTSPRRKRRKEEEGALAMVGSNVPTSGSFVSLYATSALSLVILLLCATCIHQGESVSNSLIGTLAQREAIAARTRAWASGLSGSGSVTADVVVQGRVTIPLPPCNATVSPTATGAFRTIQEAINQVPGNRVSRRWVICVAKGVYNEKVRLSSTKTYVSLVGLSANPLNVKVTWNDTAGKRVPGPLGNETLGTYNSATFAVEATYFTAMYITFENLAPRPADGAVGGQAVAMRVSANYASFVKCRFIGYQDTLYAHQGIQFYRQCYIRGSIDFIFGNGTAWFAYCDMFADVVSYGFLTAQKRDAMSQESGFAFKSGTLNGTGLVYLGRAWGPAARVVFYKTYMSNVTMPLRWDPWGQSTAALYYGEFECTGPGSNRAGQVPWAINLTYQQAKIFGSCDFINAKQWQNDSGLAVGLRPC